MDTTLTAVLLGIVEGLTEFLPVSSTGHLILATEMFGYDADEWAMFNVVIQLGAILAVVYQYWPTFWGAGMGVLKLESEGLRFARNILLAFIPSVILGLAFKDYIDIMLGSPSIVAWALILGGIAIIGIEKASSPGDEVKVADLPMKTVIGIGLAQCTAMIPGVSRSGATIMGALAMGVNRKTAAEFSFFLAVPTMIGATTLELFQKGDALMAGTTSVGWYEIAIGFVVSFIVALIVIRLFVAFVSRRGFTPFAWYRIVVGTVAIAWLTLR
ncbi:undecaprenyl-diphosphate phosphatase [Alteraurantiacibacter aestuarii]|uniref:Undecaprenyl-diphosphatase n=1 Tax=Alteraurantiacibacter aestuarii TaxID=650004 RepID=A0A844ZKR1_9SPHN|nr:undecaprenyl-diphosphate phosphatase [Alteraurantiacibacter aestuarii]MXO88395.1 undecaprenyl-diphosphate phosphatase [Alteraurantiacibacter aestuarii]